MEDSRNDQEPAMGWTESLGEHAANPAPGPAPSGDGISALGRDWVLARLENRIKAQFEQWVRRNAKLSLADADGQEESEALRSAYIGDFGAGHYNWNGRYVRKALGDWPGIQYLFFLLLRRNHPEVTESKAEAIFKDNPRSCGLALAWAQGNSDSSGEKDKLPGASQTAKRENGVTEPTMTAREWKAKFIQEAARQAVEVEKKSSPVTMESSD